MGANMTPVTRYLLAPAINPKDKAGWDFVIWWPEMELALHIAHITHRISMSIWGLS